MFFQYIYHQDQETETASWAKFLDLYRKLLKCLTNETILISKYQISHTLAVIYHLYLHMWYDLPYLELKGCSCYSDFMKCYQRLSRKSIKQGIVKESHVLFLKKHFTGTYQPFWYVFRTLPYITRCFWTFYFGIWYDFDFDFAFSWELVLLLFYFLLGFHISNKRVTFRKS